MSRRAKIILAVVALVVVGAIVLVITVGGSVGIEVEVAEVLEEDLAVTVTASGRVESGVRADVYPPTVGTLVAVRVEDGAQVKAGDILAQMDTVPLQAAVSQAEVALAAAQSQLAAVDKQEPTSDDIALAQAGTDAAWTGYQASLDAVLAVDDQAPTDADKKAAAAATSAAYDGWQSALSAFEVVEFIYETSASPSPSLEASFTAAKIAASSAESGYYQAKSAEDKLTGFDDSVARSQAQAAADQAYASYLSARLQQTKTEGLDLCAERRAAQASVDQAREALVIAQDNLSDAMLRAPIDGTVLFNTIGVSPSADGEIPTAGIGSAVSQQAAPFTVVDLEALTFVADVDEVDVGRIDEGLAARVSLDAFPTDEFESSVVRIESAAQQTPTGGTVFPISLPLSDIGIAGVRIGMKGDTQIELSAVPSAITIPVEALFDEGGTTYVYLVVGDRLERTKVELGTLTEMRAQITSGVEAGDTVALSGALELIDGLPVTVAE